MKLYPESEKIFDEGLFQKPPKEYRGAPFWAWNTSLEKDRLKEQIDVLEKMGMGGFHIHSRIGLATEYLGREFMEDVRYCMETAKGKGMRCWLYDEDKWPSGYGAGRVTENPAYKNRFLLFSPEKKEDGYMRQKTPKQMTRLATGGDGRLLARYEVVLKKGKLSSYRLLAAGEEAGENTWYAYCVAAETSPWFNNQSYVDTLNPEATKQFLKNTHERYAEVLEDEFSKTVPAIFTDEPQFSQKDNFSFAESKEELKIPYTEDLESGYREKYGFSLLEHLPELFWELPTRASKVRYAYHDYVAERFASAYADTIGAWCDAHGLLLSGHMMEEADLGSQTRSLGEAMRQYRGFGLPGIDMLADRYEYNTAKQAQSIVHQYGRQGMLSELYGVTNWDFDFRRHKRQGDWQAALGVTLRVHHLSWLCMKGEAKRDYPAPIDEHSPWYRKYHVIEDYFARLNAVLTRGKPEVHVGVIHPVESYWISYGPNDQTSAEREGMEQAFRNLTEWLLFSLIDFDFICESLLPRQAGTDKNSGCTVGNMRYDVVVVPPLKTIRRSTLQFLKKLEGNGGTVLWLGKKPEYVDAEKQTGIEEATKFGRTIPFSAYDICDALEPFRVLAMTGEDGKMTEDYLCNIREEGDCKWVFLAPGRKREKISVPMQKRYLLRFAGTYQIKEYCAMDGNSRALAAEISGKETKVWVSLWEDDSILLRLEKKETGEEAAGFRKTAEPLCLGYLKEPDSYMLEEENVLLLDRGSFVLDGEAYPGDMELLKAEDLIRKKFGYRLRTESFPQPWLVKKKEEGCHELLLKCRIPSKIEAAGIRLAVEAQEGWNISWNGEPCGSTDKYWLDRAIRLYELPLVRKGFNELLLEIPFGENTELEWMYLLGEFGVQCRGGSAVLTERPEKITYGDISRQDFPFYGGNLTYVSELELKEEGHILIQIPDYAGSLAEVSTDGSAEGKTLFLSPYAADLGVLKRGKHRIVITCYGNRFNQFGQLHNRNHNEVYYGPKTWRTEGAAWSEEYQLRPAGILSAPVIYRKEE